MIDLSTRSLLRGLRAVVAGCVTCAAGIASAGYVTTFESGMDAIFKQTSFDTRPIDIRFNATVTVAAGNLLSIDSSQEFSDLSALRGSLASNIVSVFFVDAIPYCGGAGDFIIGCGSTPGNLIALKSSAAADSSIGANLMAHELGHNLGLGHTVDENLMNGTINSTRTFLNFAQVSSIFATLPETGIPRSDDIIQRDGSQYFISITPFAVVASVPEPQTWAMMLLGLLGIGTWVRRRKTRACSA